MHAELAGIWHGLQLAKQKGITRLWVESDSTSAIHMLASGCASTHPCAPIIHDIKRIIKEFPQVQIAHSFREANRCADSLANYGHSLG